VVIPRPQQPIVKINVQFVLNGSPPHLAGSLSCCNLAIELSRNLVTEDYLAACVVSFCENGRQFTKLNKFYYGRSRKFYNVGFHSFQHSPSITGVIKPRRWVECVERMGDLLNTAKPACSGRARNRNVFVADRFRFIYVLEV
jgi:hypothetical protein